MPIRREQLNSKGPPSGQEKLDPQGERGYEERSVSLNPPQMNEQPASKNLSDTSNLDFPGAKTSTGS